MDRPLSILASWKIFLPEGAIIMAKRAPVSARVPVPEPTVVAPREKKFVSVVFEAPGIGSAGAQELFDKIIVALELGVNEFAVVENPVGGDTVSGPGEFTSPFRVRFISAQGEAVGDWAPEGSSEILTTYSLASMIMNPGLKKAVWGHLKEAVARARRK